MRSFLALFAPFCTLILAACSTPLENPWNLTDTPDLSVFHTVVLTSNNLPLREIGAAQFVADGAFVDVRLPSTPNSQRLFVQVEQCRDSLDPQCQRRYTLSGDLDVFATRLKCYLQIRNDINAGYQNQAIQGLCQDPHSRSYSITLSR